MQSIRPTHCALASVLTSPLCLRSQQLENAKKRERTTSDPRATEQKQEKKRPKTSKKPKDPEEAPEKDFTPFDYSKSDFKAFAGEDWPGTLAGL